MKLFVIVLIALVTECEGRYVRRTTDANFDIHVVEKNTSYTERVKLDFDKNFVIINVPAHNDVNAMDEMHDMDNGLTVQCLPVMKKCFLIDLDRGHIGSLEDQEDRLLALWKKNGLHIDDTDPGSVIVRKNWTVTEGPLKSLDFLRKEVREFIMNRPVYRIKLLPDDADILLEGPVPVTSSVQKKAPRPRRTVDVEIQAFLSRINDKSSKAMSIVNRECHKGLRPKIKYGYVAGVPTKTCDYLMWCGSDFNECKTRHMINFVFYQCLCCPEHKYAGQCWGCEEIL